MNDFFFAELKPILTGAPGRIRTCDLLIRSQTLYPTELRALRVSYAGIRPQRRIRDVRDSDKVGTSWDDPEPRRHSRG